MREVTTSPEPGNYHTSFAKPQFPGSSLHVKEASVHTPHPFQELPCDPQGRKGLVLSQKPNLEGHFERETHHVSLKISQIYSCKQGELQIQKNTEEFMKFVQRRLRILFVTSVFSL